MFLHRQFGIVELKTVDLALSLIFSSFEQNATVEDWNLELLREIIQSNALLTRSSSLWQLYVLFSEMRSTSGKLDSQTIESLTKMINSDWDIVVSKSEDADLKSLDLDSLRESCLEVFEKRKDFHSIKTKIQSFSHLSRYNVDSAQTFGSKTIEEDIVSNKFSIWKYYFLNSTNQLPLAKPVEFLVLNEVVRSSDLLNLPTTLKYLEIARPIPSSLLEDILKRFKKTLTHLTLCRYPSESETTALKQTTITHLTVRSGVPGLAGDLDSLALKELTFTNVDWNAAIFNFRTSQQTVTNFQFRNSSFMITVNRGTASIRKLEPNLKEIVISQFNLCNSICSEPPALGTTQGDLLAYFKSCQDFNIQFETSTSGRNCSAHKEIIKVRAPGILLNVNVTKQFTFEIVNFFLEYLYGDNLHSSLLEKKEILAGLYELSKIGLVSTLQNGLRSLVEKEFLSKSTIESTFENDLKNLHSLSQKEGDLTLHSVVDRTQFIHELTPEWEKQRLSQPQASDFMRCHSSIVFARSEWIKTYFHSALKKSKDSGSLQLELSFDGLNSLLTFIYTNKIPQQCTCLVELWQFGELALLPNLTRLCSEQISTNFSPENFLKTFLDSGVRKFEKGDELFTEYVLKNIRQIFSRAEIVLIEWVHFQSLLAYTFQYFSDDSIASEQGELHCEVLKAIMRWNKKKTTEKEERQTQTQEISTTNTKTKTPQNSSKKITVNYEKTMDRSILKVTTITSKFMSTTTSNQVVKSEITLTTLERVNLEKFMKRMTTLYNYVHLKYISSFEFHDCLEFVFPELPVRRVFVKLFGEKRSNHIGAFPSEDERKSASERIESEICTSCNGCGSRTRKVPCPKCAGTPYPCYGCDFRGYIVKYDDPCDCDCAKVALLSQQFQRTFAGELIPSVPRSLAEDPLTFQD